MNIRPIRTRAAGGATAVAEVQARRRRAVAFALVPAVVAVALGAFLLLRTVDTPAGDSPDTAAFDPAELISQQPPPQYFARVDEGVVVDVAVVDEQFLADNPDRYPGTWVEMFPESDEPGRYAGVGYLYDTDAGVFYPPAPYPSWTLDEQYTWQPPVPRPDGDVDWQWDETTRSWVEPA